MNANIYWVFQGLDPYNWLRQAYDPSDHDYDLLFHETSVQIRDRLDKSTSVNFHISSATRGASGFVTSIDFKFHGEVELTIKGLHADPDDIKPAFEAGAVGFYTYLNDALNGRLLAKGDRFENIFEVGQGGRATIDGGAGDDQANVWHKKDVTFDGGTGTDKVVFTYELGSFPPPKDGVTMDLASGKGINPFGGVLSFKNVEDISGTQAGDTIIGSGAANVLYGGLGGADVIKAAGGNDTVGLAAGLNGASKFVADGGSGKDSFIYDISFGPSSSTLDLANPAVNTGAFAHSKIAGFESYSINDFTFGQTHPSITFIGSSKSETIVTAAGNDTIDGREGNDTVTGGLGQNTFVFGTHFGKDEIVDFSVDSGNVIQFDQQVFSDFSDVKAHAHKDGFDTVIETGHGETLRLDDVKLSQLRQDDFLFT